MDKVNLIREIKKYHDRNGESYKYINISGGRVRLEDAPIRNLHAMYNNIMKKSTIRIGRPHEQYEFTFVEV